MKAPKYVDNNRYQLIELKKNYFSHQQRLEELYTRQMTQKHQQEQSYIQSKHLTEQMLINNRIYQNFKLEIIENKNRQLLSKLIQISTSQNKFGAENKIKIFSTQRSLAQSQIRKQNIKILQRIQQQEPVVNSKSLKKINEYQDLKKRLQKVDKSIVFNVDCVKSKFSGINCSQQNDKSMQKIKFKQQIEKIEQKNYQEEQSESEQENFQSEQEEYQEHVSIANEQQDEYDDDFEDNYQQIQQTNQDLNDIN